VNGQVFAVWVSPTELAPGEYCDFALKGADTFDAVCRRRKESVAGVQTPHEFRQAVTSGRVAANAKVKMQWSK